MIAAALARLAPEHDARGAQAARHRRPARDRTLGHEDHLSLTVNGEPVQALVEPRTHLADFLRDQQRLTGTHLGCEHGVCGACTVLDRRPAGALVHHLRGAVRGREVRTVEGFDDDAVMKELRAAFSREHALQCGFCTPGMLIAARDLVLRLPDADERRIRVEMSGNLCRCTGYVGIVRAISSRDRRRGGPSNEPAGRTASSRPPPARFTPRGSGDSHRRRQPPQAASGEGGTRIEDEVHGRRIRSTRCGRRSPTCRRWRPACRARRSPSTPAIRVKGRISVKFGPMRAAFAGAATLERDDAAKRGVIRGAGQDALSASRARGDIAYRLLDAGDGAHARRGQHRLQPAGTARAVLARRPGAGSSSAAWWRSSRAQPRRGISAAGGSAFGRAGGAARRGRRVLAMAAGPE